MDTSLITCAEYQLFLDEQRVQGRYLQPDHWTSHHFPAGRGNEPVLGMRPSDATAFCAWLTERERGPWQYRLPEADELRNESLLGGLPLGTGYWLRDGSFSWPRGIPPLPSTVVQEVEQNFALKRPFMHHRPLDLDRTFISQNTLMKALDLQRNLSTQRNLNLQGNFQQLLNQQLSLQGNLRELLNLQLSLQGSLQELLSLQQPLQSIPQHQLEPAQLGRLSRLQEHLQSGFQLQEQFQSGFQWQFERQFEQQFLLQQLLQLELERQRQRQHDFMRQCQRELEDKLFHIYPSYQVMSSTQGRRLKLHRSTRKFAEELENAVTSWLEISLDLVMWEKRLHGELPACEGMLVVKERRSWLP